MKVLPPACSIAGDRIVDVGDVDIAEPDRPRAMLLHLIGERQDAAGKLAVAPADHPIAVGELRTCGSMFQPITAS